MTETELFSFVEIKRRHDDDGYWLDVMVDRAPRPRLSLVFETESERRRAFADMMRMLRASGAQPLPERDQ